MRFVFLMIWWIFRNEFSFLKQICYISYIRLESLVKKCTHSPACITDIGKFTLSCCFVYYLVNVKSPKNNVQCKSGEKWPKNNCHTIFITVVSKSKKPLAWLTIAATRLNMMTVTEFINKDSTINCTKTSRHLQCQKKFQIILKIFDGILMLVHIQRKSWRKKMLEANYNYVERRGVRVTGLVNYFEFCL